jgi:seryl-tRNA synthetase
MIDIALLRRDPEFVRRITARRTGDAGFLDEITTLDARHRAALTLVEQCKAEKSALSASVAHATDRAAEAQRLRPHIAALDARIAEAGTAIPALEQRIDAMLAEVPNLLDDSVPDGAGERDNLVLRTCGVIPTFDFTPKPHWEIGEALRTAVFRSCAVTGRVSRARSSIFSWIALISADT